MVDACPKESLTLKLHPVNSPLQVGLLEIVHHIRQWCLFYLHDEDYLDYKVYNCAHSMIRRTHSHKCYIEECKLEFWTHCYGSSDLRRRMKERDQRMAHELLLMRGDAVDPNHPSSSSNAENTKIVVDLPQDAWQYLIKNDLLAPRQGLLQVGFIELQCEFASGPPGRWQEDKKKEASEPELGDIVIRRGDPAVITAIDSSMNPPCYILRVIETNLEINCERHDFLAKGDPRLGEIMRRHERKESSAPEGVHGY